MRAPKNESIAERLARYSMPEPNSGCQLWTGGCDTMGYGTVGIEGHSFKSHRVAYTVYRGPIPAGMFVCHRCDVRSCINPDHLFLGTHKQNMDDMTTKRRRRLLGSHAGEANAQSILTEANVRDIRLDLREIGLIAAEYGVHRATIIHVKRRLSWTHVK